MENHVLKMNLFFLPRRNSDAEAENSFMHGRSARYERMCPSIHEKFRVNGTRSWITGCTGETGNGVENDVIWRSTPFIQPPGINWVNGTSYPSILIFSWKEISNSE